MANQQKVVYDLSNDAIFNDWTTPTLSFKVTPFFDNEYLRNGTTIRHYHWNARDLHTPYATVSFWMTLSDLEWLSKILNDTKRRAVSLRQLSFLYIVHPKFDSYSAYTLCLKTRT